jgi:hypothetical protein
VKTITPALQKPPFSATANWSLVTTPFIANDHSFQDKSCCICSSTDQGIQLQVHAL